MGTTAVQKCMDLFLAYPFNNALHRHVATLLLAFDAGSDAVVDFLMGDCNLLSWLASAPEQVRSAPLGSALSRHVIPQIWPAHMPARVQSVNQKQGYLTIPILGSSWSQPACS